MSHSRWKLGLLLALSALSVSGCDDNDVMNGVRPGSTNPTTVLVQVQLEPTAANYSVGETVEIATMIYDAENVGSVPFRIAYDPAVLEYVGAVEGDFLNRDGTNTVFLAAVSVPGEITVGLSRLGAADGASGVGTLATFEFRAAGVGPAELGFVGASVKDPSAAQLPSRFDIIPVQVD